MSLSTAEDRSSTLRSIFGGPFHCSFKVQVSGSIFFFSGTNFQNYRVLAGWIQVMSLFHFGTWNFSQSFVFGSIFYNFLHLWQLFFSMVKGWLATNDVLVNSREQLCSNCETSRQIFGGSFQWFWSGKSLARYCSTWERCNCENRNLQVVLVSSFLSLNFFIQILSTECEP